MNHSFRSSLKKQDMSVDSYQHHGNDHSLYWWTLPSQHANVSIITEVHEQNMNTYGNAISLMPIMLVMIYYNCHMMYENQLLFPICHWWNFRACVWKRKIVFCFAMFRCEKLTFLLSLNRNDFFVFAVSSSKLKFCFCLLFIRKFIFLCLIYIM